MRSSGTLSCIAAGAGFGAMGVLGKLAYDDGVTVGTLLAARFALAALVFWALIAASGAGRELRALRRRDVLTALALGAGCYAAQAGAYFAALPRMDAGLLSLLVYSVPGVRHGRGDRPRARERGQTARRRAGDRPDGLVLVLAGAETGGLDPLATALGLCAALVCTVYILVSGSIAERMSPQLFSTLVCSGAAVTLSAGSAALGQLQPGAVTAPGWAWLACLALVSTVAAISLQFAGIARVGPTVASILCTVEPVVTVVLAFVVFGEVLGGAQLLGGGLVLLGVIVLQLRPRERLATA